MQGASATVQNTTNVGDFDSTSHERRDVDVETKSLILVTFIPPKSLFAPYGELSIMASARVARLPRVRGECTVL